MTASEGILVCFGGLFVFDKTINDLERKEVSYATVFSYMLSSTIDTVEIGVYANAVPVFNSVSEWQKRG